MTTAYGLDYQHVLVHAVGWAPTAGQDDGSWLTTWTIRLRDPLDSDTGALDQVAADASLNDPSFKVTLTATGERKIEAAVVTRNQGQDAAYWGPTYALLIAIDSAVGRIWTVDEKPRLWYPPFQTAQQDLLRQLAKPNVNTFLANCVERVTPFFLATAPGTEPDRDALFRQAVDLLAHGDEGSGPAFSQTFASFAELTEPTPAHMRQELRDVRRETVTAVLAALRAASTGSAQLAALCSRKVFDAAYLYDQIVHGPAPEGFAFIEDDLGWRDIHDLLTASGAVQLAAIHVRSLAAAAATSTKLVGTLGIALQ